VHIECVHPLTLGPLHVPAAKTKTGIRHLGFENKIETTIDINKALFIYFDELMNRFLTFFWNVCRIGYVCKMYSLL